MLHAGNKLIIPCPDNSSAFTPAASSAAAPVTICENSPTHRVSHGETLFRIAQRYGVTVDSIVVANHLVNARLIYVGQELIIPCGNDSGISAVSPDQPGVDSPALPSDTGSLNTFCQQSWGDVPPDIQVFINQLCTQ